MHTCSSRTLWMIRSCIQGNKMVLETWDKEIKWFLSNFWWLCYNCMCTERLHICTRSPTLQSRQPRPQAAWHQRPRCGYDRKPPCMHARPRNKVCAGERGGVIAMSCMHTSTYIHAFVHSHTPTGTHVVAWHLDSTSEGTKDGNLERITDVGFWHTHTHTHRDTHIHRFSGVQLQNLDKRVLQYCR